MNLHTTAIGHGEPRLIFLHGLFGQGRNWTTVARGLEPLGSSLLVDLPNHGRSDWTETFSYPAMADAVAGLLRAGPGPAVVVGHSMGGKVAMVLALRHPELVRGLIVVDVSPDASADGYGFSSIADALSALDLDQVADRKSADAELAASIPDAGVRGFLLQNLRHRPHGEPGMRWQFNLGLLSRELAEVSGWPAELNDRHYDGPVLWVAGERSDYVSERQYPAMMRLFPETALLTVPGAGHWVHSEQPAATIEGLRNFLLAEGLLGGPTP